MAVTEASHVASRVLDDLYRRHGGEVYRYTLAVLGNHADAEDVTQTTFLNAYRSLEQGVRPRKPTNWLLTIASNAIKQRYRQEQARPRHVELDRDIAGTSTDDETPTVGELLTALSKIPPQQRQAIVLREFEGRSYSEIADILGVTTSALETLLFRARRSLAEELEHHLTCTEAQLAVSRAADGRLGRKERRRLREHLVECPDCAHFARLQQRHRRALKGLALIPIPLSFTLFKGLEGSAAAATLPAVGAGAAATGSGAASATGGGIFAGGVVVKAAAVVAAAGVAGGVTVGATHIAANRGHSPTPAHSKAAIPSKGASTLTGAGLGAKGKGKALGTIDQAPGRTHSAGAPGQALRKNRGTASGSHSNGTTAASHRKSSDATTSHTPVAKGKTKSTNASANGKGTTTEQSGTSTAAESPGHSRNAATP
jgi:RNA polymerase sigma factor (sigma-70 family)